MQVGTLNILGLFGGRGARTRLSFVVAVVAISHVCGVILSVHPQPVATPWPVVHEGEVYTRIKSEQKDLAPPQVTLRESSTPYASQAIVGERKLVIRPQYLAVVEWRSGSDVKVKMDTAPVGGDVTVQLSVTRELGARISFSSNPLTFTSSNWSEFQAVTVSTSVDSNTLDEWGEIYVTASGGGYDGIIGTVRLVVAERECPSSHIFPHSKIVREGRPCVVMSTCRAKIPSDAGGDYMYFFHSGGAPRPGTDLGSPAEPGTDLVVSGPDKVPLNLEQQGGETIGTTDIIYDHYAAPADGVPEGDEWMNCYCSLYPSGANYFEKESILILDSDVWDVSDVTAEESDGVMPFVVEFPKPVARDLTLSYGTKDGTAIAGVDYTQSIGFVTVKKGDKSADIGVPLTVDNIAEGPETFELGTRSGKFAGFSEVMATGTIGPESHLVLVPSPLSVEEGGDAAYSVVLGKKPSGDVSVTITGHVGTNLTLDTQDLSYTSLNWNVAQSVTVTAALDTDADDEKVVLVHTASGADYTGVKEDLAVTILDENSVVLVIDPPRLNIHEGRPGRAFAVSLGFPAVGGDVSVGVTIAASLDGKVLLNKTSLVFTASDWDKAQSITVTAEDDADAVDEAGTLFLLASGGGYDGNSASVSVQVVDDEDEPAIVLSPSLALTVAEGSSDTYTIALATRPSGPVTITISGHSGTDLTLNPVSASLTFARSKWNEPQTVEIRAGHDNDTSDDAVTLVHTASGGGYGSVSATLAVTVDDEDEPGIVLSPSLALTVAEGRSGTYTIALATRPSGPVTITISGHSGTDLTLNPVSASLTFARSKWNEPQTVEIRAGHDNDTSDDAVTLVHTASGGGYGSVSATLAVTVDDEDESGIVLSPSLALTVAEGRSGTYTIALATRPSGPVTITISGHSGTDLTLKPVSASLTFAASNWDSPQLVTVHAAEDQDSEDDKATLTHNASGADYDSIVGPSLAVTVMDNDASSGLLVSPTYLEVDEGTGGHFSVELLAKPKQAVEVQIRGDWGPGLTVRPTRFLFTGDNWDSPVSVAVEAEDDEDHLDARVRLTLTASGGEYEGKTEVVEVVIRDNDEPGIVLSPDALAMVEGGEQSYAVSLDTRPSGEVMVAITTQANSDLTLNPTSLTFTSGNWNTQQVVTVRAIEDSDTSDDHERLTHQASGGDYDGESSYLMVTIQDDDKVRLGLSPAVLRLEEGAVGDSFSVWLGAVPTQEVVVSVGLDSALSGKVSMMPTSLTYTPANWGVRQIVAVHALDDADSNDELGEVQLSASGGGYDGEFGRVRVEVVDDDSPYRVDIVSTEVAASEEAGPVHFRVRLNRKNFVDVTTVDYSTRDGTATAGMDYMFTSGVIEFGVAELEQSVMVQIIDDDLEEDDESFTLELTDVRGAELGTAMGRATIVDNDEVLTVSMDPSAYVREGGVAKVHFRLSNISTVPVEVTYSTHDVTASAGEDYEAVRSGSVIIEPGSASAVVTIATKDDVVYEGRESFVVQREGGARTLVMILDNDREPGLSLGDVTVSEDGGLARLSVTLRGISATRVGVAYATWDGTAKAGEDYVRTMGTLVFASGETTRYIGVPLLHDDVSEADETFTVMLSAPEHAGLFDAEGVVTIMDVPTEVSIYDGAASEDSEELVLPVRLNYSSSKVVSVRFAVTGGTATADLDYEAAKGLVVFEPGSVEAQVRIPLTDDDVLEDDETVEVSLSDPVNAVLGRGIATGTIVDDETVPGVRLRALAVSASEAVFVVLASGGRVLTARYRTVDGTAMAGRDYEQREGMLELGPGETRKEVRVPLLRGGRSGEDFAFVVEVGGWTLREEVVLQAEGVRRRARWGRTLAVHIVEAVSDRIQGQRMSCMPRPYPGQRVRASHLLSGCGVQADGERIGIWGRGAFSRLEGGSDVVTASLGADYLLGGRWMLGVIVSRSEAARSEAGLLMQVTGWYPYVRYGGLRHHVWGLAGAGEGEETGLRLMAAGLTGVVVGRSGVRLSYEADGFWLGMDGAIGVSRMRAGLEGSLRLQDMLEPYVEAAVLHSGGDAERGLGMEAGGGLRVRMQRLHAEVMSRRLVVHAEDGVEEWGYAGMVRFGGLEGLGAQLRPAWGHTRVGALWHAERPWEVYPSDRRMDMEVGYGSMLGGHSVLRPLVGLGVRDGGRDYRIGAGVRGHRGIGFSISGLAMEHTTPYRPVNYGVTATGYARW